MNNILVVNVNWLGDVIFSTPVFKALKTAYPQARVSCLAVPRVKEVLEHCPFIDEIIIYDEKGCHWGPWGKLSLILSLRRRKFDAAFLLHRSLTRALMIYLAGIPQRIGFKSSKPALFLTRQVMLADDLHRMNEYTELFKSTGIQVDDVAELRVFDSEVESVHKLLAGHGITSKDFVVVVNAGGNWDLKRWPIEKFAQLTARLVRDFKVKVVIPGADKDVVLAHSIAQLSGVNPVVLAGATGLKQLIALFKRANCVISNDTGPLHLAAGVGTDVIALFGPTRPEITGPRGRGRAIVLHKEIGCNKAPCYHLACSRNQCLHEITVDDVCQALQTIRHS